MNFKLIYFLFVLILSHKFYAQEDSLFAYLNEKNRVNIFGGLKAYYFWEEDSNGYIIGKQFRSAFKLNQSILLQDNAKSQKYSDTVLRQAISLFAQDNSSKLIRSKFRVQLHGKEKRICLPLERSYSHTVQSLVYRKQNQNWGSEDLGNVLYFKIFPDTSMRFSKASDSLFLKNDSIKLKAFGHYFVKQFVNEVGEIVDEQVYSFDGEDVGSVLDGVNKPTPKHLIVFANGYRGRRNNKDVTDNLVTSKDRFHYWLRLDKAFIRRIKPDNYFYIDGNHSISTSNHRTMANFTLSYSRIKSLRKKEKNRNEYHLLNTSPNDSGFYLRKENGKLAGQSFLALKCNSVNCFEVKDTLDIVCHSMGYAYSLGFIETVRDYVVLRNFYIIAAENACCDSTDWSKFKEVWQYGTHLEGENPEPVWQQDGIAPQCAVKGINDIPNGGRVYFPIDSKNLNFVNSHMLNHYRWIFNRLNESDKGFVKP